jgi:hypothetical protein
MLILLLRRLIRGERLPKLKNKISLLTLRENIRRWQTILMVPLDQESMKVWMERTSLMPPDKSDSEIAYFCDPSRFMI